MQKKYERIVSWVQTEIENGALSRGDKLPSENELMERFRVSRQTVRRLSPRAGGREEAVRSSWKQPNSLQKSCYIAVSNNARRLD